MLKPITKDKSYFDLTRHVLLLPVTSCAKCVLSKKEVSS